MPTAFFSDFNCFTIFNSSMVFSSVATSVTPVMLLSLIFSPVRPVFSGSVTALKMTGIFVSAFSYRFLQSRSTRD